jgi:iron complex outermembrane receptor protein
MKLACTLFLLLVPTTAAWAQEEPAVPPKVEEVMVVTASRTEQSLHEVPNAVAVITADDLERLPAGNYGDILRNVSGLNVTQISARDIQVSGRSATGTLSTSELVLLDGRTLYLDFFGFVMWDFLPVNAGEIKQIEVAHGPSSAIWGANAMTGVINVITKRPSEMEGTTLILGGGDRGTILGNITHAGTRDPWGYKISAGYYEQDPFERPAGLIPGTQTPYPSFENQGAKQPKADLRFDYTIADNSSVSFGGGYAGTDGLVHSGIGPFDVENGSAMSYIKGEWSRAALRVGVFANHLDVDSTNLLQVGIDGRPIASVFQTDTYNAEMTNTSVIGTRNILTYGVTARHNTFDLTIAPLGEERNEYGGFLQDEILFGDARWVLGGRWDNIDPIGSVISPRTALLYQPVDNHTVRVSYSRAFRAPSLVNNYLDTAILNIAPLPTGPFIFATAAVGNPDLEEERMDAYEIGYVGTLPGRVTLTANAYRNVLKGSTDFYPATFYTAAHPPAGWPLPPAFLDFPPLRNALPSSFSYRNVGRIVNRGLELAVNTRASRNWSWFANYSWQDDPAVSGVPAEEISVPPQHRANVGTGFDQGTWFVNGNVNYQSEAMWRDVLDARYWGPTDSFTSVNAGAGIRLRDGRVTISATATNLFDERIQQHVFGDIISRKITGQIQLRY